MGDAAEVVAGVSEVGDRGRRSAFLTGEGGWLVTPSRWPVTAGLAAIVLVEPSEQMAMLSVGPMPQLPREDPPATVMLLLTSLRTLVLPGSVMVIWLCALPGFLALLGVVIPFT